MDTFGMLLFMFGVLGFWVFLIMFIIRKARKVDTQKSGVLTIVCLGASFLGIIIGVASTPDSGVSSRTSVQTETRTNIDTASGETLTRQEAVQEYAQNEVKSPEETVDFPFEQPEAPSNGVDANEWPEVAALNMPNEMMISLYKEYYEAIYGDNFPEDGNDDEIEAYEEKVGQEIADKYGITPNEAFLVYAYVSMNYDKAANGGTGVSMEPEIEFGELKSVVTNGAVAIVSVKITPSLTREMTIEQNYFNVDDLIKNKGYDVFDEIEYYAFADTIQGDQVKVISFTVPKRTIELSKDEKIMGTMLADYVNDLWISPIMYK
ncbi:MAG: hypothetical protein K6G81_09870 [Lachnospiraceae bacterium]|nr:hypothetical protein [Lachnospiraceae bacterium]